MTNLAGLFTPERVAVVGATPRSGSIGRAIVENLLASFDGTVVGVNPSYDRVLEIECVDTIEEAGNPDLAVVAIPAEHIPDTLRQLGEAGVKNVVVISAGFAETGGDGAALERKLVEVAEAYDLNLVGPNCLGILATGNGLNASFAPTNPLHGSISFMSQSGAFITAVLDWATDEGIGFANVVSLGNKAVLDEVDFLRAWGEDPGTEVIVGYLEGIEAGREFIETAREVGRETPIVLVKAGRTEAGAQAASSHTAAIAGSERAYVAGFEQAGVLRADGVQELFDVAQLLAGQPVPDGDRVAIVTNAGGPGVLATDAVGDAELELADFRKATIERLEASLPETASIYNPVDLVGDADVDRFRATLTTAMADEAVDMGLVVAAPTAVLDFDGLAEVLVACQREVGKPIAACLMGGDRVESARAVLAEAGIPNYFDPARAVDGLSALARHRRYAKREVGRPRQFDVDREHVESVLGAAATAEVRRLGVESMSVLDAYGIPVPAGDVVDDPAAAVRVAEDLDGPVVMKIVSPEISHKSDIGGVKVGVALDEVEDAFEDLVSRARNYQPDARIEGVQVQELVPVDEGVETIVGVNRDPQFGHLLLFGLGGIFVEVIGDTSVRVAPVTDREAREMIDGIDAVGLLRGARGRAPVDEPAIAETIQRLSQLVTDHPSILELDVNPLVALPDGVVAVDLRLTLATEEERPTHRPAGDGDRSIVRTPPTEDTNP